MKTRTIIVVGLSLLLTAVILGSCGGSRSVADLGSRELFDQGLNKYEQEKYRRASEYFQALVFNYPGNSVVDTAQYYLGLSYYGNEEYELAAIEFNRLAVNYPSSVFFENAVFMKAVAYFEATPEHYGLDQTELERAITLFEDFLIDFPESPLVADAQTYLLKARTRMAHKFYEAGIVYERIGAPDAAKKYFQKVMDDYTDTEYGPLATYHKALMELRRKQFADARQQFENFVAVFPEHDLAAEAREKAAEAAFRHCRETYEEGEYTTARECLVNFKQQYPDDGRVDDAVEYIEEIDKLPPDTTQQQEHAET